MIGIIILTHGSLGVELLKTAEMIIGKQDKVDILSVQSGSSLSELATRLDSLKEKYQNDGLLILTDMFGGSPSNIAMAYLDDKNVEVVTGVNLPMIIKAFSIRKDVASPQELAKFASNTAKDSIIIAGELLKK
ncbi:PTS sugar transporter subunit IIA [Deferribacterales bacterium Es71-Z0220]|jgi:PTS system mannose-specific IIA component|uniref:PTS sugar transporter subunit IIA n=1 Tax=Deferrivibrio essentukiensis TaxID=2880922 RepID=UPI001F6076BE|nr:PTS sugar transporter subunit IIA [Deferrivibrio essentukiensis]MBZ4671810.1 system fructose subfamily component [Deferribacteraceae bacterium]MCB4204491.1 PTS sugar transporter subunit IIA [Deferrivibrio essentukiensis]